MGKRIPSSFTSSFKIHESLAVENQLDIAVETRLLLARWITCFLVVQFDVDIGPDLKLIAPRIKFSETDFHTICFSCLPEKTPVEGSLKEPHVFRWTCDTDVRPAEAQTPENEAMGAPGTLLYGYVLFSQRKDDLCTRGYMQESLVIISPHYLPKLFITCLETIVTEAYLDNNQGMVERYPVIETAVQLVSKWPDPFRNCELGFFGITWSLVWSEEQKHTGEFEFNERLTDSSSDTTMNPGGRFSSWVELLPLLADVDDLYSIYEAVLLQRPLGIYANSPHIVSAFISCILDMVLPLHYPEDRVRDYVTIHTHKQEPDQEVFPGIVGLTNPFLMQYSVNFLKAENSHRLEDIPLLIPLSPVHDSRKLKLRRPRKKIKTVARNQANGSSKPLTRQSTLSRLRNQISMPSLSSWYYSSPTTITNETYEEMSTTAPSNDDEEHQIKHSLKSANKQQLLRQCIAPSKKFLADVVALYNDPYVQDQVIDEYVTGHFQRLTGRMLTMLSRYLVPDDDKFIFSELDFIKDLQQNTTKRNVYSLRYSVFGRPDESAQVAVSSGGRSGEVNVISEEEMGLKFLGSGDTAKVHFFKTLVQGEMFKRWVG